MGLPHEKCGARRRCVVKSFLIDGPPALIKERTSMLLSIPAQNLTLICTFPSVYMHMCIYIYTYVHAYVCLSVCLSIYLSVGLSVCLSVCRPVYLSVCMYVYQSIHLSIYLSIHLPIYLSTCLSNFTVSFHRCNLSIIDS